jgi:mRNA-degrading endonuclease YafQ of YafQ-DinJ toxin-antitoxin module
MVEKITVYEFSNRFRKDYRALSKEIRELFEIKLPLFLSNPSHTSLRVKRLIGTADRWEGSVTMNYRFTFQFAEGKVLFRRIGAHDILRMEG